MQNDYFCCIIQHKIKGGWTVIKSVNDKPDSSRIVKVKPMENEVHIMIVANDPSVREALSNWIRKLGYRVTTLESGESGFKLLNERRWNCVIWDINVGEASGLDVLTKIKSQYSEIPVILLSEAGEVSKAIYALSRGAVDYIVKPLLPEDVVYRVKRVLNIEGLERQIEELKQRIDSFYEVDEFVGRSSVIKSIYDKIQEVAYTDKSVLIIGEAGTGKELIARLIHARSQRRYKPFVTASFGVISSSLLESELFGHEKGAFTGATFTKPGKIELANGGTLFLDAVTRIAPKTQLDLALVLNERTLRRIGGTQQIKFDVRIISATRQNLEYLTEINQYRSDLLKQISEVTIYIPPLRERQEDIPLLAEDFLEKYSTKTNKKIKRFSLSAMDLLKNYSWPGNVRELKNVVERSVILAQDDEITTDELPFNIRGYLDDSATKSIKDWEKVHILKVLQENDWNISKSAKDLKIDRVTLYNKMKKYALEKPKKGKG